MRGYLIMRRDRGTGGIFGQWTQVGLALKPEAVLTGQPTGPELEYRIIAYNTAGLGVPSNTVIAVL